MKRIGRRCRTARLGVGFDDARDFAELALIGAAHYVAIEAGNERPSLDEIMAIGRITGSSLDLLVTGRNWKAPD